ncbi:MAG: hypothetical protein J0M12_00790 [Deltaproteobacteria bacterium]|nr:hypothetical protein [Deltaproteobacteria bacterium]
MSVLKRLALAVCVLSLSACPRGETKTLGQVYDGSKQRFVAVQNAAVPQDVAQPLKDINARLEQISGQEGVQASQTASELAGLLAPLTVRAGYTARPGMGEVITEYRMLSQEGAAVKNPTVKLLAARTYSLLASELETTKFSVQ